MIHYPTVHYRNLLNVQIDSSMENTESRRVRRKRYTEDVSIDT